jgi:hypothetical protein
MLSLFNRNKKPIRIFRINMLYYCVYYNTSKKTIVAKFHKCKKMVPPNSRVARKSEEGIGCASGSFQLLVGVI